jgi:putative DNA primase/helicase
MNDVGAVTNTPEIIAQLLGGAERTGEVTWRCFCPCCGYRKCFEVFWEDDGSIGVVCYSCGPEGREAIFNELRGRGFLAGDFDPTLIRAQLVAKASAIWAGAIPIAEGNAAASYLMSRGLKPPWPSTIRANPYRTTDRNVDIVGVRHGPPPHWAFGIVCLVEHPRRGILGVHIIGLYNGGDRKNRDPRSYRRRGNLDGGGVWLGTPGGELVVGEGLETTMSAMLILGRQWGVASLGARGMTLLDLPPEAETVCIAADNDDDGREAAAFAQERWVDLGHTTRIVTPNNPGEDFNDILVGRNGK